MRFIWWSALLERRKKWRLRRSRKLKVILSRCQKFLFLEYLLEVDPVEIRELAPSSSEHDGLEEVVSKTDWNENCKDSFWLYFDTISIKLIHIDVNLHTLDVNIFCYRATRLKLVPFWSSRNDSHLCLVEISSSFNWSLGPELWKIALGTEQEYEGQEKSVADIVDKNDFHHLKLNRLLWSNQVQN